MPDCEAREVRIASQDKALHCLLLSRSVVLCCRGYKILARALLIA